MPSRRPKPRSRIKLPPLPPGWTGPWVRYGLAALLFAVVTLIVPRWWAGRDGHRWYEGDLDLVLAHARAVAADLDASAPAAGEAAFRAATARALGLLQVCLAQPAARDEFLPAAERAVEALLDPRIREFDTQRWGADALADLDARTPGHAAILGPVNLALGLHRRLVPDSRHAALNDTVSAALARRLAATRHGILERAPGEAFPEDNAAVLASLLLHQRVAGANHAAATAPLLARFRLAWREPRSGLLHPAVNPETGELLGTTGAGATARAALLLSYGDRELSRELYLAVRDRCAGSFLGFGYIDEFHVGLAGREELEDASALPFGVNPAATAHALAAARLLGERHHFVSLYRTVHLIGTPASRGDARSFLVGGAAGNALLLASLTASPDSP